MRKRLTKIDKLIAINKHLRIAISHFEGGPFIGSLSTERKLISLKFKLEEILERTIKAEKWEKEGLFHKLKQ